MNPKKYLEYYSKLYPEAWKQVDKFREGRGKDLPFWPEWCFLPLSGYYAIVSTEAAAQGIDILSPEGHYLLNDIGVMGALGAWRVTQGVYRFDPDVYREVIDTPLTGDLPHEIFFNLPEWCVYVETPGLSFLDISLNGFFAYLEYDPETQRKELRIVTDHSKEDLVILVSQVLHLGSWSILEALERAVAEAKQQQREKLLWSHMPVEGYRTLVEDFIPLISLLLYICSANGDIGDEQRQPARPQPKKTKKGVRMFPAPKVYTWDVGVRMGAALRRAKAAAAPEKVVSKDSDIPHSGKRPHIRRAHWHGYWTGPRDGERKFVLKWLSPMLIGEGDLPVTIRTVE